MDDTTNKTILDELVSIYQKRTNEFLLNPDPKFSNTESRVNWSDAYACMQRYGWQDGITSARVYWNVSLGRKYMRAIGKINKGNDMKVADMSFELWKDGVYVATVAANRDNIKTFMTRTKDKYLYAVRTDGQEFHCVIKPSGRLYVTPK